MKHIYHQDGYNPMESYILESMSMEIVGELDAYYAEYVLKVFSLKTGRHTILLATYVSVENGKLYFSCPENY